LLKEEILQVMVMEVKKSKLNSYEFFTYLR
jgi:hypothetical protein